MSSQVEGVAARGRTDVGVLAGCALAVVLPIGLALVRSLRRGWYPIGDNAYFSIRARDVLTEHHPLLGTWTSASLSVGKDLNNPGPLQWDLLAPATKLLPVTGTAVATAAINIICVLLAAWAAHRGGGTTRALGVLAAAAALTWTMGSELLIDPWQPHALLFPFLLYTVLVWAIVEGDRSMLAPAVVVASLLVQAHLSYAALVLALGALGVAGMGVRAWCERRADAAAWARDARSLRNHVLLAVAAGAVCWVQPVIEQLTAEEGNLGRLLRHGGGGGGTRIGPRTALKMVADVVAVPPAWARSAFTDPFVQQERPAGEPVFFLDVPSLRTSTVAIAGVVALLAWTAWRAWRRQDVGSVAGPLVAGTALAVGWVTTASVPVRAAGLGIHQVRWLWPIGILTAAVLALGLGRAQRWLRPALAVVAVGFAVAALPAHAQAAGPSARPEAMEVMRAMASQLDDVSIEGPVLFAAADLRAMTIYEPYSTPMMFEMDRRGIGFVVDDPSQARQVGESRLHPERARVRMVLLEGDRTRQPPPGGRRIGYVAGLDAEGLAELRALERTLRDRLPETGLELTPRGIDEAARGALPGISPDGAVDTAAALGFGALLRAVELDLIAEDMAGLEEVRRYAALRLRWDRATLAAYLVPLDTPATVIR